MVHSGFEPSSVSEGFSSWRGFAAMARAALFGPRVPAPEGMPAGASVSPPRAEGLEPEGWSGDASPDALRSAFAYRGDVTLTLDDGDRVAGYVSALDARSLRLLPLDRGPDRRIPVARIRRVELSGPDAVVGA
jgi:hypothetical protein